MRQQAADVGRDDIDDVLRQRLALANRHAVADGLLDPIFVAPALLRDRAREGRGEVLDLLTHRALDVLATFLTGCAAPIVVPGAIAATFAASVMKVPAEAALAPDGATYTITGNGAARIALTIFSAEFSSPPGVSSSITSALAPPAFADASESSMKDATAGLIEPSILISSTHGGV